MKKGWQTKPLSEVCEIKPPKSEARERVTASALVSFAPMEDLGIDRKFLNASRTRPLTSVVGSYTYFADGDVLLAKITPCFENGKLGIATGLRNGIGFGSSEFIVFRPSPGLDKEFLYYFLARPEFRAEGAARMGGAVGQQRVPKEFIENYRIPVPPLTEQRRIVGIVDEAFSGIATAKANAEKNLQNARALFESHLQFVFTERGKGWIQKPFEACIEDVKYTAKIQRKEFLAQGEFPIVSQEAEFTNGYWNNRADVFKVTRPVVIFGDHTQVLKYIDFDFVLGADGVKILPTKSFLNPKFFFYSLRSAPLKSLGYARHYRLLKELQISYPDTDRQVEIVRKLDDLSEETQRLASLYERKLAALEALKKSLLHQAFTGTL
jgi:type I restriction enzyme S subunit